ncbi:hypothetical protein PtA15_4A666 [Puccinia triticina]|uniref:Uncharacterized protein n=1 Tax=Puccinia triticina TaxID=208348 RepID=A0ABY7CGI4_9BASI|nr:uncharacterized protein PtA15_4A666 [Puccinia triticina]WAQ84214.1 hypothetical protein PtA15_4A666 [Puccinia triticina]WAR55040.1 hypothetical protein PtB15_4B659 [Puccinia triticina]
MPAEHNLLCGPDTLLSRPSTSSLPQWIKDGLIPKSSFAFSELSPKNSTEILLRKISPGTTESSRKLQPAYFDRSQSRNKSALFLLTGSLAELLLTIS